MAPATPRDKRIKVCVRIRPFTKNEAVKAGGKAAWTWHDNTIYQQIFPAQIPQRRLDKRTGGGGASSTTSSITSATTDAANLPSSYSFDYLYPPASRTQTVYNETVKDAITAAMEGFHSSVFLYGQTGTGKTFTMQGTPSDPGIVYLSVQDIFEHVAQHADDIEFLLRFSYLEIYNERIYDLLAGGTKTDVKIFEVTNTTTSSRSGNSNSPLRDATCKDVVIKGLREEIVVTIDHVLSLVDAGNVHRHMATTESNDQSSRSHVIFRMVIESQHKRSTSSQQRSSSLSTHNNAPMRSATLNLIDLAGSEGVRLANTTGQHLEEGKYINRSLLTLGHIIWKLSRDRVAANPSTRRATSPTNHLPYRNSKLTRILQPSLGGSAQIAVVCTIAPSTECLPETHHTLKFASRARRLRHNRAILNETTSGESVLLRKYRMRIAELNEQLATLERRRASVLRTGRNGNNGSSGGNAQSVTLATIDARQTELRFAIHNINRVILNSGASTAATGLTTTPAPAASTAAARPSAASVLTTGAAPPTSAIRASQPPAQPPMLSTQRLSDAPSMMLRGRPRPLAIRTQPQDLVVVPERDTVDDNDVAVHVAPTAQEENENDVEYDDENDVQRIVGRPRSGHETDRNRDGGENDDEDDAAPNSRTNSNRTLVGSGASRASTKTLPLSSSSSLPTTDGGDYDANDDDVLDDEPESEDRTSTGRNQNSNPNPSQRRLSLTSMLRTKYQDAIHRIDGQQQQQQQQALLREFVQGLEIAEAEQETRMSKIHELELENRQLRQILQSREDELQTLRNSNHRASEGDDRGDDEETE